MANDYALVPTKINLLDVKGGSEVGNVGALPAIINAIIDALSGFGIDDMALPRQRRTRLARHSHATDRLLR